MKKEIKKKKVNGIDYLSETLQKTFEEHDRLLYHREKIVSYYGKAKTELDSLREEIRKTEETIRCIEDEENNLKNTLNTFRKEPLKSANYIVDDLDEEAEPLDWFLIDEEFESGYPFGLNTYISYNGQRIDFYEKRLEELQNRKKFLDDRLKRLNELLTQIDNAILLNKFKGMMSSLRLPGILSKNLNNREVPKDRPKTKKK